MRILIDGQTLQNEEINRGIGKYCTSIIHSLLKVDFHHDWYLNLPAASLAGVLDPSVLHKLRILEHPEYAVGGQDCTDRANNQRYTEVLEDTIRRERIDLYWNPNPMMHNVLFPAAAPGADMLFTLYDMIPHVFAGQYVNRWPGALKKEYYRRLNFVKDHSILFISQSARADYVRWAGVDSPAYQVAHLGVDARRSAPEACGGTRQNSVLYVGGFDFRKNLSGALEAFALAKRRYTGTLLDQTVLHLVCGSESAGMQSMEERIRRLGIRRPGIRESVHLYGYVTDAALHELYRECGVFFFPSLYEGFGLPVLEALAHGCHVLSARNSSLLEIGEGVAAWCSAEDVSEMADKLYSSLENALSESQDVIEARRTAARSMSWESTAMKTLEAIAPQKAGAAGPGRKVAILTPWPPQRSGVAYAMYEVVKEIRRRFDITVFHGGSPGRQGFHELPGVRLLPVSEFQALSGQFDEILYQVGNNVDFHGAIYRLAVQIPGIVEFHDLNIHPLLQRMALQGDQHSYDQALAYSRGCHTPGNSGKERGALPESRDFLFELAASGSRGAVVHSRWAESQLGETTGVTMIPLAVVPPVYQFAEPDRVEFCRQYGIPQEDTILACPGFINRNKRYSRILRAVGILRKQGVPVHLVFLGDAGENHDDILRICEEQGIRDHVSISGYLDEKAYHCGIYSSDIVINLRYPTMGESSATLGQAFALAKPVIVSNIGQYREFPDEAVWKVDVSEDEVRQLCSCLAFLHGNPEVRFALGMNGYRYAMYNFNIGRIGRCYRDLLNSTGE